MRLYLGLSFPGQVFDNMLFLSRVLLRVRADPWCSGVVGVTEECAAIYDVEGRQHIAEG